MQISILFLIVLLLFNVPLSLSLDISFKWDSILRHTFVILHTSLKSQQHLDLFGLPLPLTTNPTSCSSLWDPSHLKDQSSSVTSWVYQMVHHTSTTWSCVCTEAVAPGMSLPVSPTLTFHHFCIFSKGVMCFHIEP